MRNGIGRHRVDSGKETGSLVEMEKLGKEEKKLLVEQALKTVEEDSERFFLRQRQRMDRVGIDLPKIEVRFENLSVEADTYVGSRTLPTLLNATLSTLEGLVGFVGLSSSQKRVNNILKDVSGILKPSRMTLLLGPPSSGKTTLLLSLAGKLDKKLRVTGKITYCGHELSEFVPQRTFSYISQHDIHNSEMTVRETLDFSAQCLCVGTKHQLLSELSKREKHEGIKPDPEIDAFMKAEAMEGQNASIVSDYILKVLGLDICADVMVGDEMMRGISGGQKKRLTTGEMLAGPARALFMDEISTGLDTSTTFEIVKFIGQMVHIMHGTVVMSLLQPAPETFDLFDDIILLSEGQIVYQGPRQNALQFFELMGFKCPERKGVAEFLQEVTSKKDQEQYWFFTEQTYRYISVYEFSQTFKAFSLGQQLSQELKTPYDKSRAHPNALVKQKYGVSVWEIFKACLSREWLVMKRSSFIYIFKATQITIMSAIAMTVFLRTEMGHETIADGGTYFGALFYSLINVMFNGTAELIMTVRRLPVFYKQRDLLLYPAWAFGLSYSLLKIPLSLLESGLWVILTYYVIGFAPAASRFFGQFLAFFFTHQMALSLFRFLAAVGRTEVITGTLGIFGLLVCFVLGGFVISKDDIQPWCIWGYWSSPMTYAQNAIAVNEFLDSRWSKLNVDTNIDGETIGEAILQSRGMVAHNYVYWVSIGALIGFSFLFNACFILALTYLYPLENQQAVILNEKAVNDSPMKSLSKAGQRLDKAKSSPAEVNLRRNNGNNANTGDRLAKKGMVLPFQPLSLVFNHVNYFVDKPVEMKNQGLEKSRLQLLCDVSGAFRPGILTALVGVTGAGKTTLMDVLAGRKTGGYIEGSINISGYPKKQATFARVSGYCEQNDIHSPNVTVYESLAYSAWLRLGPEIHQETRKMFVEEVMELVELDLLKDAMVGLPGVDGLSTEQRKRLTIAVELVANPSIIFMDEPTSGLDARAAAIVMRTVRNTANMGRTVVCTIHQPSIDIFEAFDELLLMKRGGHAIYAGPLGHRSHKLIEYFEAIPGIVKINKWHNPATWMLEISSHSVESRLNLDFAEVYSKSTLYQENQKLIKELSIPAPGSKDLSFATKYAHNFNTQFIACFWKQRLSYWRNPQYNGLRFFVTVIVGLLCGSIFWKKGQKMNKQQDLSNLMGATYAAVFFLGGSIASSVQPVVGIERTAFYRERAAGMYSSLSYAFAQVCVEIMYISVQSIIYALLLFSMIDYGWRADKFFWFLYFIFMSLLYFTLYGMMAVALTANYQIAAIVYSFFLGFWNLFAGFIIPRPLIPIWWRWYYWANPVAWTLYGVLASQLGEKENLVEIPGNSSIQCKELLKEMLGYEHSFLGYVAVAHVGFVLLFFFVFVYGIRYLNFQKR